MPTNTPNLSLAKALGADITSTYLKTNLGPSLDTLDASVAQVFNVKGSGYGAKGDGVTNDTAAIVATLAAAKAAGGGIVFFPRGTYLVTAKITIDSTFSNITLMGTGRGNSIIKSTVVGDYLFLVTAPGPQINFFHLTLQGRGTNSGIDPECGLGFFNHGYGRVSDCEITGFGYDAMRSNSPLYCSYDHNWLHNNQNEGILVNGNTNGYSDVFNNYVYSNNSHGIDINNQYIRVVGNKVRGNQIGITVEGNSGLIAPVGIVVAENHIESNTIAGINISASTGTVDEVTIANNWIRNNGSVGQVSCGIIATATSGTPITHLLIANNNISHQGLIGGTRNNAIDISNADHVAIVGNQVNATVAGGVDLIFGTGMGTDVFVPEQQLVNKTIYNANATGALWNSTNQSIASNVGLVTAVTFDTILDNDNGLWISGATRLTARISGIYLVSACVEYAANATGTRSLFLRVSGGATYAAADTRGGSGTDATRCSVSARLKLAAGDYVEVLARQDSGGALNIVSASGYSPVFTMTRVRP